MNLKITVSQGQSAKKFLLVLSITQEKASDRLTVTNKQNVDHRAIKGRSDTKATDIIIRMIMVTLRLLLFDSNLFIKFGSKNLKLLKMLEINKKMFGFSNAILFL